MAERVELTKRADKLCTACKAHTEAGMKKLGLPIQELFLPKPRPSLSPRRIYRFSGRGRTDLNSFLEGSDWVVEKIDTFDRLLFLKCLAGSGDDIEDFEESLEYSKGDSFPQSRPPVDDRMAPVLPPLVPKPPEVQQTNKKGARQRTISPPLNLSEGTGETEGNLSLQTEEHTEVDLWEEKLECIHLNCVPRSWLPKRAPVDLECSQQTFVPKSRLPVLEKRVPVPLPIVPKPPTGQRANTGEKTEDHCSLHAPQQKSIPGSRHPVPAKRAPVLAPLAPKPPTGRRANTDGARSGRLLRPVTPDKGTGEKTEDHCSLQATQQKSISRSKLPDAAKRVPVLPPLAPGPPKKPQTKKRGAQPGRFLPPIKGTDKKASSGCSPQTTKDTKVVMPPLPMPAASLNLCFQLLSSDDWMNKIEGLKDVQALAQHHMEILKPKLHEVSLVLIEEVKNLRSAVACEAISTLAEMYVHLQKAMDPEVEATGQALLLKLAQTPSVFIHEQVNLALRAMVENCSHARVLNALLNKGLSHLCVAVRCGMARHLHQLADSMGAACILTDGKGLTESFLAAASQIAVDAAPEVRKHGQTILHTLARHKDFQRLWKKTIPDKERYYVNKLLKKAKK